tara:strand:+ start:137 stop:1216 length:1080 start_codon:yes stop_codon:yes gene_type:complete
MRIGVSLLNLRLGKMGGFEIFLKKIVELLPKSSNKDEIIFFVNSSNHQFVPDKELKIEIPWSEKKTNFYRIVEAVLPNIKSSITNIIHKEKLDIMLFPHQAMFPIGINVPSVIVVADIQHIYFKKYFKLIDLIFRKLTYDKAIFKCNKIIAISQFTADSLCTNFSVDRNKIEVVHHGFSCSKSYDVEAKSKNDPYIYYPAASFPHKGHKILFESFAFLKRNKFLPHKLILSGMRDKFWKKLIKYIDEDIKEFIVDYGFIDYDQVKNLYHGADAIVFPTEFEGFGLPVLEAVQFNKKIICSRLSVFDEIGVPKKYQIDFSDPNELYEAIISEIPFRLEKKPLTWENSINRIYNVLRKTAN